MMKKVKTIVIEGVELSYKEINLSKRKSLVLIYLDTKLISSRKKSKNRKNFYYYKLYNGKFFGKNSDQKALNVIFGEYNIINPNIITFYENPYSQIEEYLSKQKSYDKNVGFKCICDGHVGYFNLLGQDFVDFMDLDSEGWGL